MTAPLRSGEPIEWTSALGDRAYKIVIGRGLIATSGEQIRESRRVARLRSSPTRWRRAIICGGGGGADRVRARRLVDQGSGRGGQAKASRQLERVSDALLAAKIERGDCRDARRRRGRRSRRLRRSGGSPRRRLHAGADDACSPRSIPRSAARPRSTPRQGKNLVGAFYQPILVIADTALLDMLPEREFRAGYAEVVKYGLLGDAAFFEWLDAHWRTCSPAAILAVCARPRHRGELPRQGGHRRARRT